MSLHQVHSAFNLLGQVQKTPPQSVHLPAPDSLAPRSIPTLNISWGAFHQGVVSNLGALLTGPAAKNFLHEGFFKDGWIEGRIPRLALLIALLLHVALVVVPFPRALTAVRHNPAFDNTTLTWSGPINDLPLLDMSTAHEKTSAHAGVSQHQTAPPSPDAFHPRQRIFTDAPHPTHTRQTLINPKAPFEAPEILPALPNLVALEQAAAPARPRMQIDQQALAKLHPRERRAATSPVAPPPDVIITQQQQADVTIQATPTGPARPKLALNPGAAPRLAPRPQSGDSSAAPDLAELQPSATAGNPATLIALSAAPAPPAANVAVPAGNLSAQVSISPDGKPGGTGSGGASTTPSAKTGSISPGSNPVTVAISGGSPSPKSNVSGLGGGSGSAAVPSAKITLTSPRDMLSHHPTLAESDEAAARTGPPNFASLSPGSKPESIFNFRKIYTLYVNMPNLSSSTGSWQLNFSELRAGPSHLASTTLAAPVPTRKVDPKYPPTLANEHVEGEIVLYAVIRRDGSIDSIQLVRGLDPVLNANSIAALSQWQFRPATKSENGTDTPVELEAIVHIPFHAPPKP